jgi:ankyrin repeat protein
MTDPRASFIDASLWHGSLDRAAEILAARPEIAGESGGELRLDGAGSNIYTAAILGDDSAVHRFLQLDAGNATAKGGPRGWDALTYLCFSKYLRLDPARSDAFVRAATALLDAGASANSGFFDTSHQPAPEFESVLYGAAGVAHHAAMTRLLVARGADPNDGETPYHAPESYDNSAVKVLLESGKLTEDSRTTMLLRKADVHDHDGMKLVLEHGADPNRLTRWGLTSLHQSVRRDNGIEMIALLLDHGANPLLENRDGRSAVAIAARRGRDDALALFEKRGFFVELGGAERLIAACARNDAAAIRAAATPDLVREVLAEGGTLLAEFAANGNTEGVAHLLDLGVNVAALHEQGDIYYDVAPNSTALHAAAWRAQHVAVKYLIQRSAPVNALDGKGRSALALAVKACVDSYWTHRRSPESVAALLNAGASRDGVAFPSGYAEVDELLA